MFSHPALTPFSWPDGARMAATLSFDIDGEAPLLWDDAENGARLGIMSHQMFGPKVGVPRILDILARNGVSATFFVPGFIAERYPDMVRIIMDQGHEIGHHGYLHEPLAGMTAEREREFLERGLEALDRVAGVRPIGYRAPVGELSFHTPGLLLDAGFAYDSSLMDADRPYLLGADGRAGSLVELPFHWSTDDWEQYCWIPGIDDGRPIETTEKTHQVWAEEIEGQRHYGGLFNLVNHPFVSGRASRMVALERLVRFLVEDEEIWLTRLDRVAEHARGLSLEPIVHQGYPEDLGV